MFLATGPLGNYPVTFSSAISFHLLLLLGVRMTKSAFGV